MLKLVKNKTSILILLIIVFNMTIAAYLPFPVIFMSGKGFNNTEIGTILSINSVIVIIALPLWGMISDRIKSLKKIFVFCIGGAAIIYNFIPFVDTIHSMTMIFPIFILFQCALVPFMDYWIIQEVKKIENVEYGNIRLWGSLCYAIMAFVYGRLIDSFSIRVIFMIFGALSVISIWVATKVKDEKVPTKEKFKISDIRYLIRNYNYVIFLVFCIIFFAAMRGTMVFMPQFLKILGGSDGDFGTLVFFQTMSEIPILFASKYLIRRFKPIYLIFVSALLHTIRLFLLVSAGSVVQIMFIQLLQGPAQSLFMVGVLYYIDEIAPDNMKSSFQTFATAFYSGVSGIVGNYGGGWMIDQLGVVTVFRIAIYVCFGAIVIFGMLHYAGKLTNSSLKATGGNNKAG